MRRTGLLGGTFDPIHNAHIFMGQLCADALELEKVIYIPAGITPHKSRKMESPETRYEMVRLAVADNPKFEVSDYETKKSTPSYSVETVRHFKKLYPNDELVFIFGEDSLDYVDEWYKADELLCLCSFAVVGRGGSEKDIMEKAEKLRKRFAATVYYVRSEEMMISSGMVRKMAAEGKSIADLVPACVCEYIMKNNIYRGENGEK